ncbi:unnamed protein product [Allacma fusca]|uniref:Uncharacterized protein n=1 Tax=Allacma fusca TaxID=39272 RepID=A0A8J2KLC9_9HEXA|nr:unnamed protein product [Allacma fusca]
MVPICNNNNNSPQKICHFCKGFYTIQCTSHLLLRLHSIMCNKSSEQYRNEAEIIHRDFGYTITLNSKIIRDNNKKFKALTRQVPQYNLFLTDYMQRSKDTYF